MEQHFPRELSFSRHRLLSIDMSRHRAVTYKLLTVGYCLVFSTLFLFPLFLLAGVLRIFFGDVRLGVDLGTGWWVILSIFASSLSAFLAIIYGWISSRWQISWQAQILMRLRETEQSFFAEIEETIEAILEPAVGECGATA